MKNAFEVVVCEGEPYVVTVQFRDDALSAVEIAALGAAVTGPIQVPEPAVAAPAVLVLVATCIRRRSARG